MRTLYILQKGVLKLSQMTKDIITLVIIAIGSVYAVWQADDWKGDDK